MSSEKLFVLPSWANEKICRKVLPELREASEQKVIEWLLNRGYKISKISEVEKCMIAMVDASEFERMQTWVSEQGKDKR